MPADRRVEHLLIGGGIAGATAARTLREEGADGSILLVGRELDPPYHRPPISKAYLQGRETRAQTLVFEPGWWAEHDIDLKVRTSVTELDPVARTARLSSGETVEFETALLATGAMVRRLGVDGSQLDGIHYLRALANADSLRRDIDGVERIVIVGGSYIGCEVAASLTALGKKCTILMQEAVTLERHFGAQAGHFFQEILEAHGIDVVGDDEIDRFEGDGDRVRTVVTGNGRAIPADAVVCGVGAIPDVMLARKAGLALGPSGGVLVDACLETSQAGVYAAGDICEYASAVHGRVLRIEHEDVAAEQARTAARNMLGQDRPHVAVPYFFSDLADWASLEYVGPAAAWDDEVIRGSIGDGDFTLFYLAAGRVVAALGVGPSAQLDHARRLIVAATPIPDPAVLARGDLDRLAASTS
ncbi:MAG TPA: FAD-dependent oxidoreductase [Solirubrobacteraceae bacterium]|jgi:3-phenylpropionate/trans-cinnamate dioxygenase ferredoxin reductase subunit|nr:FAD-dependent oxidoreductase [Solirubrobacteraceae bacterium]